MSFEYFDICYCERVSHSRRKKTGTRFLGVGEEGKWKNVRLEHGGVDWSG